MGTLLSIGYCVVGIGFGFGTLLSVWVGIGALLSIFAGNGMGLSSLICVVGIRFGLLRMILSY